MYPVGFYQILYETLIADLKLENLIMKIKIHPSLNSVTKNLETNIK